MYHIEIDLTEEDLQHFSAEHNALMIEMLKNRIPAEYFNAVWKVHNQITMAQAAILKGAV